VRNNEALSILRGSLSGYRSRSFSELKEFIGKGPEAVQLVGDSGTRYSLEFEAFWDGSKGGPIRVSGAIDDGGLSSFVPVVEDFIMAPDGTFVGE
jgi:hypothetical protein